jgi:hypothetical protein
MGKLEAEVARGEIHVASGVGSGDGTDILGSISAQFPQLQKKRRPKTALFQ